MSEPEISIAMATYNGERFLKEQLDSFSLQTRLPDELVVTDDGSSDNTLEILHSFQSTAPFEVRIRRNSERLGTDKNFEKAVSLCSGDVIFLSDQDDVWFPGKIQRVVSHFAANPKIMVVTNDQIVTDEELAPQGAGAFQALKATGKGEWEFPPGSCTAMRRDWRKAVLPIPAGATTYDSWTNRLTDLLGARTVLPEPLQFYRRHASNTSAWLSDAPRKVSAVGLVRLYGLQDARPGWQREISEKKLYAQRLEALAGLLGSLHLEEARRDALGRIYPEVRTIERRSSLMDLPRWRRIPAVIRFSMEGGYANFVGWKSALKDALR